MGSGNIGEGGQKAQNFSDKISKSGDVRNSKETIVNGAVLYIGRELRASIFILEKKEKRNCNHAR